MSPGEGLPIFPTSPRGEQSDYPSLRASNEHSVIVRVLRARKTVWLPPSYLSEAARCASPGDHQAPSPPLFREQEDDWATRSFLPCQVLKHSKILHSVS